MAGAVNVIVNVCILQTPLTGVKHYTQELLVRFGEHISTVGPKRKTGGVRGHAWE